MNTVASMPAGVNAGFHDVVEPFLHQPGLPFAEVLSAKDIKQAFAQRDVCDIFLWRSLSVVFTMTYRNSAYWR